jgi:predicted nuclease of predicted toxin-antitoxin system
MTGPKLLFDENLSYRLVNLLAAFFPESAHIEDVGLHGCLDEDVWGYARKHGYVLVSKDNDFRQLSFLRGAPPKVVWLRIGNAPTQAIVELLGSRQADIESFVQDPDTALLLIQIEREYP